MRIAICDDLPGDRARLLELSRAFFAAVGQTPQCLAYESGEALLADLPGGAFSLAFLDIYMGGISGVETARRIKQITPDCAVIFTTTSREHGADAFDVDAFHYLVKPIEREKLYAVLSKWYETLCDAKTVAFKCGRGMRTVLIRDILYAEVLGRCCTVHTATERLEATLSLAALEDELPAGQFYRPIRYCLAALGHIQAVREADVLLDNGEALPLSRREKENLRRQLAAWRLRRLRGR